jgi:hypothetical protein
MGEKGSLCAFRSSSVEMSSAHVDGDGRMQRQDLGLSSEAGF